MKVEIDLPEIDGYEYTGEFRIPNEGEFGLFLDGSGVVQAEAYARYHRFILKPVEKWIVPTLEYLQEHYKWGEKVEARVRDDENDAWHTDELMSLDGVDDGCGVFECDFDYYRFCEIKEIK